MLEKTATMAEPRSDAAANAVAAHAEELARLNEGETGRPFDDALGGAWAAKQGALGAFANAGQICTSVERIYVVEQIAEEFLVHLVAEADNVTDSAALGPLVAESLRDRVHAQVVAAVREGATVRTGGTIPAGDGFHYPATVIVDPPPFSNLMTEETFGPVADLDMARGCLTR